MDETYKQGAAEIASNEPACDDVSQCISGAEAVDVVKYVESLTRELERMCHEKQLTKLAAVLKYARLEARETCLEEG